MRRSLGSVLVVPVALVVLLVAGPASLVGLPVPQPGAEPIDLFPDGEVVEEPDLPADAGTAELPSPTLREPFAIGEALYDPAGVPDAVVSLLERMGVPIVADQAVADRAPRLTLSEAEARVLVDMGVEDAEAATASDEGAFPYTFGDVHAVVAPFLGDVGVERLAELYAGAYERRPDDLAPGVLMGQPIDQELKWLKNKCRRCWEIARSSGASSGEVRSRADFAIRLFTNPIDLRARKIMHDCRNPLARNSPTFTLGHTPVTRSAPRLAADRADRIDRFRLSHLPGDL